jgi:hypothetical protein
MPVCSGVPQGSVLGPLLFLIFVNDLPNKLLPAALSKLYADDLKLFQSIRCLQDCVTLQANVDAIWQWSVEWQLPLSVKKCVVMDFGKNCHETDILLNNSPLPVVVDVTDLGILFKSNLSFSCHISSVVSRAKARCAMLFRCFITKQVQFLLKGFICYVRPILEYCCQVWSPSGKMDIELMESVQRSFTKRLPGLKDLSYRDRLNMLSLRTLEDRRLRLDLVLCFNILHGFTCIPAHEIGLVLSNTCTRGHSLKLSIAQPDVKTRAQYFGNRVVKVWNVLPESLIMCESTVLFKQRLNSVDLSAFLLLAD